VVAQGTPEDVAATEASHTGQYLGKLLRRAPGRLPVLSTREG
jgi:excinuclease ABC subunit A